MNIKNKINYYKESLDCFNETMEKYKFLLDQGKKSLPFPEEYRQDSFKVSGCQAQVWLVPYLKNNLISFLMLYFVISFFKEFAKSILEKEFL